MIPIGSANKGEEFTIDSEQSSSGSPTPSPPIPSTELSTNTAGAPAMRQHIVALNIKSYSTKSERWRRRSSAQVEHVPPSHFPSSIRVVSWNIDFMAPNSIARLHTVLDHIRTRVLKGTNGTSTPETSCILLQEVAREAFPALLGHAWVRKYFQVVPTSTDAWPAGSYGVVTLVSRSLVVVKAQSLEFPGSIMGRSALIVDIHFRVPDDQTETSSTKEGGEGAESNKNAGEEDDGSDAVTVRIANTHLESLPMGAEERPIQLGATAILLRQESVDGGIVCGDMNAIGPSDADIHIRAGLLDAWTRGDDDAAGYTWGYQPKCQFPVGRLDKVLYTPSEYVEVDEPRRVGAGLKTAAGQWASDHYGLITTVRVV